MSHSVHTGILPEIAIPDAWFWNDQLAELPFLAEELASWSENLEKIIMDLMDHTSLAVSGVTQLWREAFLNINSIAYKWIKLLLNKMENSLWHIRYSGQLSRYSQPGIARFSIAIDTLKQRYDALCEAVLTLWIGLNEVVKNVPQYGNTTTARPPIEILFNAILLTRASPSPSARHTLASMGSHWLQNFPTSTVPKSFQGGTTEEAPIGTPQCLAALYTGPRLSTGSTLIQYGVFIARLTVNHQGTDVELPSYHRDMRYSRYSKREQGVLNALVNRAVDWLTADVVRLQRQTRGITQGFARATAAANMENNGRNIRAPCLRNEDRNQVGQAYQGKSLAFKRKCPFCATLYSYSVAVPGSVPYVEVDWNMLAEADENRPRNLRGCCAEALAFIQGVHHRQPGSLRRLQNELGLSHSN